LLLTTEIKEISPGRGQQGEQTRPIPENNGLL
jgi:hypothetical protein